MRRLAILLLAMTAQYASGQLSPPVINLPNGTYVNMAWTYMSVSAVVGVFPKICWTLDGSTPTATVAGTCDNNGAIWNSNGNATPGSAAAEFDGAGTYVLKAIATMVGQTNSSVVARTYTVTSTPALGLLTWVTPTQKITASSPGINYFWPHVITAPSGRILVFYGSGVGAMDHGKTNKILLKYSDDNAATWQDYAPSQVTKVVLSNVGSGYTGTPTCSIAGGGGSGATCTVGAPVNGAIPSVTLDTPGSGYNTSPSPFYCCPYVCTVSGGGGTGATCEVWTNDTVADIGMSGIRMVSYGSGYSSTPTCTITRTGVVIANPATCHFGAPVNGAITSLTLTARGSGYTSAPVATLSGTGTLATADALLNNCEAGDVSNCFWHDSAYGENGNFGGGVTYNGTVIFTSVDVQLFLNRTRGLGIFRSSDNGANWDLKFNLVHSSPTITHAPANLISIPSGSPGVTGPCATGCLIQWATDQTNGNQNYIIRSFDDGLTWSGYFAVGSTFPHNDEESAIAWTGGMNLIVYTRVGRAASNNLGWPEPIMVHKSSDLGQTWTQFQSNLPTGPCMALNPNSYFWQDQFTKPVGFVNPNNPAQFTFMYGERFLCQSAGTSDTRWRSVTFNMSNTFTGNGQNTPMPQILSLAPVNLQYGSGHTAYAGAWPMTNNKVLMAWEQAVSLTAEDIFVSTFSYPATPALTITSTSPLANGTATVPYSVALNATGGIPAYTWSVTAGNLAPCGLSLSAGGSVNGAIPITGVCNFTAQVTDTVATSVTKPFTVTIVDPFGIRFSGGVTIK